jgi:glycosyltransferase involved in cell wall biosynthesis
MPDREITAADPHDGPLRVLHIVGKRAFADRNGTDIFIRAIQRATRPIHVTMHSIDEHLPDVVRSRYLSVDRFPSAVDDRWEMYRDQHVLVLPRRYGGLCLPALEAAACGLAVVMPDASPNRELASVLVEPRPGLGRMLKLACGSVREIGVNYVDFGETLNQLAADRNWLGERMAAADDAVPRWSRWRAEYMRHLAEPS